MKKIPFLTVAMFLFFTSCQTIRTFSFMQVLEATPSSANGEIKNVANGMVYENEDCIIFYKLWDEGGNAGFEIHNKTDEMLYLDLSKSFFIKNGIAYNYFLNREWGTSSSKTQTAVSAAGSSSFSNSSSGAAMIKFRDPVVTTPNPYVAQNNTTTQSLVRKEEQIMAIPPHKSKLVAEYSITNTLIIDCDMERYPSEKSQQLTYDKDNSPITFANYITYNKGNGTADKVIENEFYISSVINYAEPAISEYVAREETCANLKHPDAAATTAYSAYYLVYDKYLKEGVVSPASFYIPYSTTSQKVIYEGKTYYWNSLRGGYTTYQSYY